MKRIVKITVFFLIASCCNQKTNNDVKESKGEISCEIVYSIHNVSNVNISDTLILMENLYVVDQKFYYKNNSCYIIKDTIRDYEELTVVRNGEILYVYVYPVYLNDIGPYNATLKNGILLMLDKKMLKVEEMVPYIEESDICNKLGSISK